MYKIYLPEENRTLLCEDGRMLYDLLSQHGMLDAPCGGRGVCGKCRVTVEGESVLSCLYTVDRDITVEIPQKTAIGEIVSSGYCKEFRPDHHEAGLYGIAVDIGTTTVVATLVALDTAKELLSLSCLNSQKAYGQDVITRIHYSSEKSDGVKILQEAIAGDLFRLTQQLCRQCGIDPTQIVRVTVGGNTTMIHLLLGIDPIGLARAPYQPAFHGAVRIKAEALGLNFAEEAELYCLPAISSFVGGDITAGILACDLSSLPEKVLFIDIGTNGEIVLSNQGEICCCSCAAGPALEGMNISCGMRAAHGAIEDLTITEDAVSYKTIGDSPAQGICGSGLLAAISELCRVGILHPTGRLLPHPLVEKIDDKKVFVIDRQREIYLTQKDIRQVQLAKGAILSGVKALLEQEKLSAQEVERVMVAGQFGAHLKPQSLIGAGLLPAQWIDRISYVGNTSKTGAALCLLSEQECRTAEEILAGATYIELSTLEGYEDSFVKCLGF